MQVLEKLKLKIRIKEEDKKFGALILTLPHARNSYNGEILGRTLADWLAFACGNMPYKKLDYDGKDNVLNFAKNYIDNKVDYTIILLSTTPLLERDVVSDIVEYCTVKNINICKLPVGYVINNEYLLNNNNPTIDSLYSQHLESFYIVENKKQYNYALEVLQERINTFHMNNGVDIKKPKSVYIEPEVDIASGVIIYPNNSLKGSSTIGENVILKENNVIDNSKIGKNSCLSSSNIKGSVISDNVYISSFCDVVNGLIGSCCTIGSGVKIYNHKLEDNSKVSANSVLGEDDDSSSWSGQSR